MTQPVMLARPLGPSYTGAWSSCGLDRNWAQVNTNQCNAERWLVIQCRHCYWLVGCLWSEEDDPVFELFEVPHQIRIVDQAELD